MPLHDSYIYYKPSSPQISQLRLCSADFLHSCHWWMGLFLMELPREQKAQIVLCPCYDYGPIEFLSNTIIHSCLCPLKCTIYFIMVCSKNKYKHNVIAFTLTSELHVLLCYSLHSFFGASGFNLYHHSSIPKRIVWQCSDQTLLWPSIFISTWLDHGASTYWSKHSSVHFGWVKHSSWWSKERHSVLIDVGEPHATNQRPENRNDK